MVTVYVHASVSRQLRLMLLSNAMGSGRFRRGFSVETSLIATPVLPLKLKGGDPYPRSIFRELLTSDVVLLYMSPSYRPTTTSWITEALHLRAQLPYESEFAADRASSRFDWPQCLPCCVQLHALDPLRLNQFTAQLFGASVLDCIEY